MFLVICTRAFYLPGLLHVRSFMYVYVDPNKPKAKLSPSSSVNLLLKTISRCALIRYISRQVVDFQAWFELGTEFALYYV